MRGHLALLQQPGRLEMRVLALAAVWALLLSVAGMEVQKWQRNRWVSMWLTGSEGGTWHSTGLGGPLPFHASFDRVGGVCPNGFYARGVRFERCVQMCD